MDRMSKFEKERNKSKAISIAMLCITIFIFVATASYAYFVNKENNRIREFIMNYDKSASVFYLQQDLFGGKK